MIGVYLMTDGTGPADEPKRTKCVQGWSRQIGRLGITHYCFLVHINIV